MLASRGIDARTVPGHGGQFDVLRGGEVVFSKAREGRFPDEAEIVAALG